MASEPEYPILIFWSDEDECFVATIPDLKPCSGFGPTPEKALAEVLVAKDAWLEVARERGFPLPVPTAGLAAVSAVQQVGATAISRTE